jgi:ribulose-5-phosphate 4-epimerase/fuculose-1-phosphate aldolase
MATEQEIMEKVATSCRILAQHGLVKGSTGHVSYRIPGEDWIYIRGRPKVDNGLRFAEPESIIKVDLDGNVIGDAHGVRRIGEIYIHTEIFKKRPEVSCVIHAHPPGVLLCTMTDLKLRPIFGGYEPPGWKMADQGIPVYDRTITLHTLDETTPFIDVMGDKDVCLMKAHGIAVAGTSIEQATSAAITLESLARLNYYASLRGVDVPEIPQEDKDVWADRARADAGAGAATREEGGGNWAYLTSLLNTGAVQVDDVGMMFR